MSPPHQQKKGWSWSSMLATGLFVAWLGKTFMGFRSMMNPMSGIKVNPGEPSLQNVWEPDTQMEADVYVAVQPHAFNPSELPRGGYQVPTAKCLSYAPTM